MSAEAYEKLLREFELYRVEARAERAEIERKSRVALIEAYKSQVEDMRGILREQREFTLQIVRALHPPDFKHRVLDILPSVAEALNGVAAAYVRSRADAEATAGEDEDDEKVTCPVCGQENCPEDVFADTGTDTDKALRPQAGQWTVAESQGHVLGTVRVDPRDNLRVFWHVVDMVARHDNLNVVIVTGPDGASKSVFRPGFEPKAPEASGD